MEKACGVEVGGQIRALRRLLYCGEWIESHALHVFMLHAPDFLGYASAIELARDHPDVVTSAARSSRRSGNELMTVVGGREVHPINVSVGGWYRAPPQARAGDAGASARARARDRARGGELTAGLRLPRLRAGLRAVALAAARRVPDRPRPASSRTAGSTSPSRSTRSTSSRSTSSWSNALHSQLVDARLVPRAGPSPGSRSPPTGSRRSPARPQGGRPRPVRAKPVPSIVVRCVELVYAADEALRLIADYEEPDAPAVAVEPRAGRRARLHRGAARPLYHRYEIDARRHDPRRQDRAADVAEPADDRGGPARRGRALARRRPTTSSRSSASRRSATTTPASPARRTS